ncbi:14371_t:CDS:2 [Funneliformis mosseae]|uniref:14371_t:CDS:1 n=1 Tax=Funneliformis mosseae TaxID=27381 RepID=A0A9N9AHL9_FUNMO|nr:14371_t:CDS:2 [Funneliformis mosseae]
MLFYVVSDSAKDKPNKRGGHQRAFNSYYISRFRRSSILGSQVPIGRVFDPWVRNGLQFLIQDFNFGTEVAESEIASGVNLVSRLESF